MHRIVPEFITDNYRAGQLSGQFPAAAMFVDLSGFSTITDVLMRDRQHGAERLSALMLSVFEPVVRVIFEHGGMILGFAGDALTAAFPGDGDLCPAACEALASAFAVREKIASIATLQTPHGAFPVTAKIGLACGVVSWGILESPDRGRAIYYFRGNPVEESARAEHHARAGEIVLSGSAYDCLTGLMQVEATGEFSRVVGLHASLPLPHEIDEGRADPEVARIFAPELLVAEGLRGEFRQVVTLFVRLPELTDDGLRRLMLAVFDLQDRYAGFISRLDFGDKGSNLLILWGAPTAYENDIRRALNFALDLRSRLEFPIAAGVTFQMAHAGYIGSRLSEDYTCSGLGVNLAARFMMSAEPGSIWLDNSIGSRMGRAFEIEYQGEQSFKGFAQPQGIYLLRGRKAEADSPYSGSLAGREAELQQLAQDVQPLWDGKFAGVTVVRGEAGIGKSRLVREFRSVASLSDRGVLWAFCPADQIVRQSFNPFRYWLLRYFDVLGLPDDALRLAALNAALDSLITDILDETIIDDLRRTRSFLAALVDIYWPESPYERMDAQARYDNTILALTALLKAESLRQPVILLVEDAHELDEDSKIFLSRLKRSLAAAASYPIAILATSRAEGAEALVEDGFADRVIDLVGLSAEAMRSLSNDVLGRPAAPDLIRFVEGRAEGNPFFAEQILYYLRDESLLESNASGIWNVRPGWQSSVLPVDITAMLIARLDRLARQVRQIVQTASVLGREFEIQVLARMLDNDIALGDEVAAATRASIWSPLSQLRYMFRHSLLRDAAYSMQLLTHRRELHGLALDALEMLYADELQLHYPELAYHSQQAERVEKARLYLRKAADAARDAYQNAEALNFYTRALSFIAMEDLVARFEILEERVHLYRRLGDRNAEAFDLNGLEQIAETLASASLNARVRMLHAKHVLSLGDFEQAAAQAAQAAESARAAGDITVALGASLLLPEAALRQGHLDEAMQQAERALLLAQQQERPAEQGVALNLMGLTALEQKRNSLARVFLEATLEIARLVGDRALEWKSLNNLGNAAGFVEGDYASARDFYEQASVIVHERGDRPAECTVLANLGWSAGIQGDLPRALDYQQRALTIAREIGDPLQEAYTLINLSALSGVQANASTAREFASDAEVLTTRIGDRSGLAWALLYKGYAFLLEQALDQAEAAFQRSVGIREELQQRGLAAEPLAGLIQVAMERGDLNAAARLADTILVHLEAGGTLEGAEEPLRIYYACYRVLAATGDTRSNTVLAVARKMLAVQLARFRDDEARRMYVENVPWRLAVLQASDARGLM